MNIDPHIYQRDITLNPPIPVEVVETDTDLYWHMALVLHQLIEQNNASGRVTSVILPVGPIFQYRRFITLLKFRPLDLSRLHCFFMDEYLTDTDEWIPEESSLSFRGLVRREFLAPMPPSAKLNPAHIYFPNPHNPEAYDQTIQNLGGVDICFAGVGIGGHLAFNEPEASLADETFCALNSRCLNLSPETITINSNTAMRGAFDLIPRRAVTVGFRQIIESRELRVYLNRPWQSAVVRKMLYAPMGSWFPATFVRKHPRASLTITEEAAQKPVFALK